MMKSPRSYSLFDVATDCEDSLLKLKTLRALHKVAFEACLEISASPMREKSENENDPLMQTICLLDAMGDVLENVIKERQAQCDA